MALKPFIGIKRIWYGNVFASAVSASSLKTWLGTATEVKNSHQDTWGYTEDDPAYTDYINELSGGIYGTDEGWAAPDEAGIVNMGVVAMTKTGNYIVFSNAAVIGKGNQVEKNIGLGVTAVALDNPNDGVKSDYLFDGSKVDTAGG